VIGINSDVNFMGYFSAWPSPFAGFPSQTGKRRIRAPSPEGLKRKAGMRPQSPQRYRPPNRVSNPATILRAAVVARAAVVLLAPQAFAKKAAGASAAAKAGTETSSGTSAASALRVDTSKVHRLYMDGEFDPAIALLEDYLKEPRQYGHNDSVFIFKHLGVMYAARYETREKGKYYMHRLLEVEPTARIMDMYASDMIYMIFKNIQEEYMQNNPSTAYAADDSKPRRSPRRAPEREPEPRPERGTAKFEEKSSGKKWIWAGAAALTVAAGVGAYVLMNDEPKTVTKDYSF
jgi:hypothetical protein